jgi:hypothetical protein
LGPYSAALDITRAKRDAEARRYRLQVRLSLVAQKARGDKAAAVLTQAEALRRQVDAVAIPAAPEGLEAARGALDALEPQILALQRTAGVEEYGLPLFPKWLKFVSWTAPLVVLFGILAVILERRRRRSSPDAAAVATLEAAAAQDE